MPVLTVHVGRCADTFVGARLVLTVAAVIMDGSKTKTKTMSETKLRSKTATSSGKTKTTRSALSATARTNIAPGASGARGAARSSSSKGNKVPMGRLLSVPEKRELGIITDDRDDDDEDPSKVKPRRKPPARPPPRKDDSAGNAPPFGVPKSRILELEQAMREELRRVHTAARSSKVHLTEAFEEMDELGVGLVSHKDFQRVWDYLGVDLTAEETRAMCRFNGGGAEGEAMPYENFIKRMVRGAARQSAEKPVCRGYPVEDDDFKRKIIYPRCRKGVNAPSDFDIALADRSTLPPEAELELEFVYGYDGVTSHAQNLFFVDGDASPGGEAGAGRRTAGRDASSSKPKLGDVVAYYAASLGVVYDRARDTQRFFTGHTKDITCMTVCTARVEVNGEWYPPHSLVATGQRKPIEDPETDEDERPFVAIWDVRTCEEVARVPLETNLRSVAAVGFSPDGSSLVTVACDNSHTVQVWNWRKPGVGEVRPGGKVVGLAGEGPGFKERPVGVFGVKWDPFAKPGLERFCTWGKKHLKQWTMNPATKRWSAITMSFGEHGVGNVLSCEFLKPSEPSKTSAWDMPVTQGAVVTGMPDGSLLLWRGGKAIKRVEAHGRGQRTIQPDGTVAWGGGVRALRLRSDGLTLLTGGADGCIRQWDASKNTVGNQVTDPVSLAKYSARMETPDDDEEQDEAIDAEEGEKNDKALPPVAIRAIDCYPGSDVVIVGTDKCDVWECNVEDDRAKMVMKGHRADLRAVCWHPTAPDVFISASESGSLYLWSAAETKVLRCADVGFPVSAVACSNKALTRSAGEDEDARSHHIAVGGKNGEFAVFDETTLRPIFNTIVSNGAAVEDVKYSPDDRRVAVSTRDASLCIFLVRGKGGRGYVLQSKCEGHSAAVRHLDWSEDSSVLSSDGADYELLYWDARTGRQNLESQMDAEWATWTRVLGFPVMGVWAPGSDGTDVNACDRSPDNEFLVTADDHGGVKLFAYPAVVEDAAHREYRGHSSHVTCVRFSPDGERVITAGGRDRCVFQYRVWPVEAPEPRPPTPEKQWLPLDASGKNYGWRLP